jgi:ATP-binding cassette subfamily B (MDR/TAP) protein 1
MTDQLSKYFALFTDVKAAFSSAVVVQNILTRMPKIDLAHDKGLKLKEVRGEIEFKSVYFRYPTRKTHVLKGLNLKIEAGKTNAMVGLSGCGKSTVIQIILRFYDIERGLVTLDGVDIRTLNVPWLRSQIGLVSQEPSLFNTTVFENITLGHLNPAHVSAVLFRETNYSVEI